MAEMERMTADEVVRQLVEDPEGADLVRESLRWLETREPVGAGPNKASVLNSNGSRRLLASPGACPRNRIVPRATAGVRVATADGATPRSLITLVTLRNLRYCAPFEFSSLECASRHNALVAIAYSRSRPGRLGRQAPSNEGEIMLASLDELALESVELLPDRETMYVVAVAVGGSNVALISAGGNVTNTQTATNSGDIDIDLGGN
jgi:hypothetical protein